MYALCGACIISPPTRSSLVDDLIILYKDSHTNKFFCISPLLNRDLHFHGLNKILTFPQIIEGVSTRVRRGYQWPKK